MSRIKTSPIWKMPTEELVALVEKSKTQREVLAAFELKNKGNNYQTLKARCLADNIDLSKFSKNWGQCFLSTKPLADILIEGSTYSRTHLKRRLLQEGLLESKCYKCDLGAEWQGAPIVHVLDHINGIPDDNRLDNLRMLCPNCNSQTDTFAGKNNKMEAVKYFCVDCNCQISSKLAKRCNDCDYIRRRKIERPPFEQLQQEVIDLGYLGTGRKYGVSDNAVRKWLKTAL